MIANISGKAEDIRNRPTLQPMASPPAFNGKGPVNFGAILHALDIDQALLAHTPIGAGVNPKNFNREN